MSILLSIETATHVCSVALTSGGRLLALRETNEKNAHSKLLAVYVDEVLKEAGVKPSQLAGVAVSEGPGSYTGLRIGVSAAKGLCYAASVPLIPVGTLHSLAYAMKQFASEGDALMPAIDARRMEVYTCVFNHSLEAVTQPGPVVVSQPFFEGLPLHNRLLLAGDGGAKCLTFAGDRALLLQQVQPSAVHVAALAHQKLDARQFADTAYFEPYYMKEFVAGMPHVKGLQ